MIHEECGIHFCVRGFGCRLQAVAGEIATLRDGARRISIVLAFGLRGARADRRLT